MRCFLTRVCAICTDSVSADLCCNVYAALLSRATELAASEEGEEPAELTYAAVVVTTPDTQEGGRPRSEADDVFVPSPQYQQLKVSIPLCDLQKQDSQCMPDFLRSRYQCASDLTFFSHNLLKDCVKAWHTSNPRS